MSVLLAAARAAKLNAYAPYSKFFVGACIETTKGKHFVGCNVENASYSLTSCAESNAISAMIAAGEKHIKQIVIIVEGPGISTPCGACRQRLYEFSAPDMQIHLFDNHGNSKTYALEELLPHAFGPNDLR
jgi:cytidine deaminase